MGIEHERIHLETSSVLIRQMPISMVKKPEIWNYGPLKIGFPTKILFKKFINFCSLPKMISKYRISL